MFTKITNNLRSDIIPSLKFPVPIAVVAATETSYKAVGSRPLIIALFTSAETDIVITCLFLLFCFS